MARISANVGAALVFCGIVQEAGDGLIEAVQQQSTPARWPSR
jgi:hypothetical protein